LATVVTSD